MATAMVTVGGALLLAACSTGSSNAPASTTKPAPSTTATTSPTTAPMPGSTAKNLPLTDAVRAELIAAVSAACPGSTPSDFSGLRPGRSYYAVYGSTGTSWAAGQAVPSPAGLEGAAPAGVCLQDAGSYWLFSKEPGASSWTATAVGAVGPSNSPCPVVPPPAVTKAWGWADGSCRPPSNP